MQRSTVKWFDAKKGYGFIHHPDEGDDIFVHYTQIKSEKDFKTLRTGQTVEFEMNDGPKGLHAQSVNAIGQEADVTDVESPTSHMASANDVSSSAAEAPVRKAERGTTSSLGSTSPAADSSSAL
jgi:CspA family cold shock protein